VASKYALALSLQHANYTPLKTPVVASVGVVWVGYRHGVVGGSNDFLGQRRQDLVTLGGVEGGNACRGWDGGALESWSQLLGERAVDGGARGSREHALRGGRLLDSLPQETGTHD
jgi:hypothetical protein